jgi:ankyrin repeat protein
MKGRNKISELLSAVMSGSLVDVRKAIAQGEQVDSLDRDGRTPLFQAVVDGHMAIVAELIASGANVNAKGKHLETPLHFAAARQYRVEIAALLLNAGAQVDAQDVHGNTPLFRAVYDCKGSGDMIRLLLAHSADKHLKNKHGVSPASLASSVITDYNLSKFLQ